MVRPTKSQTLLGTLVLVTALVMPLAAAHDDAPATQSERLDHYLNSDGQNLTLTHLPPSAANASEYRVSLYSYGGYPSPARTTLVLALPAPQRTINESFGVNGLVSARYSCVAASTVPGCGGVQLTVNLLEGKRSVTLAKAQLSTSERAYGLSGQYPGHGAYRQTPHTHGDGSSADRPLYTSDIALQFVLEETQTTTSQFLRGYSIYQVAFGIDGQSVFRVWAEPQPQAAPPVVEENETAPGNEGNETAPGDEGNETAVPDDETSYGNSTANATAGQGSSAQSQVYTVDSSGSDARVPGPGIAWVMAAVGAAGLIMRRRT
jgi:hypothetical protein